MKRIVALLLTLTMLLSVVGTVAVAAEEVKPMLPYPTMTATVDEEGVLMVKFDNDVEDYDINEVELHKDWSTTYWLGPDDYDAEKKAYICEVGTEWAGAEVTIVNVNLNKWEDGKISENQYRYENGKISYVAALTGTYKETESETSRATDAVKSGRGESYWYNESGELQGYGLATISGTQKDTYEPDKNENSNTQTETFTDYETDGRQTRNGTRESSWKYASENDPEGNWFEANSNYYTEEWTENFWAGTAPVLTGKWTESRSNSTKSSQTEWTNQSTEHKEESEYNTKGVLIYKRVEDDAWDGKTSTFSRDGKLYDAYGNLLYGYTESDKPAERAESYYRKNGLESTDIYQYTTNDDGTRAPGYTQRTEASYSWDEYGNHWKNEETVTKPTTITYQDASGEEQSYTYNATTRTEYDKDGGVTQVKEHTENETYDAEQKATVFTKTDTTYVGAASAGELKETTVTTQISGEDQSKYMTVTTDYTGAVVKATVESYTSTPATATTKGTYVYRNLTTENGKQTSGTIETTTYNYDDNGHDSYTSVTTNEEGKITESTERLWSKEDGKYTTVKSYNDENGMLRGKETIKSEEEYGDDEATYTDKDGKVLYNRVYTGSAYIYTDADGKEIGYANATSAKIPKILDGKTSLALNGWWEYAFEEQKDTEGNTRYKMTSKNYDKDENLLDESVNDPVTGKSTETYYSKYDTGKTLVSDSESRNEDGNTTSGVTFHQNPGYVKSKTITRTPTTEKDSEGRTTKYVQATTTEYFDLSGKTDRSVAETKTWTYTYDDEGNTTTTTATVTEWKDASGATVVTKTENPEAGSGENSVEYKKADGTVIGYEKTTENDDGTTTQESLTATFNPYTGYVSSTEKKVEVTEEQNGWEERVKYNYERQENGIVMDTETEERTDAGSKGNEAHYYKQDDGSVALGYDNAWEWSEEEKGSTWSGHSYYPSGKVGRTWEGSEKYDPESTARNYKEVNRDVNGNVSYTVEGTITEIAQADDTDNVWSEFRWNTAEVRNLVYKDAEGNVIGYEKTDENGNLVSKIPNYYDDNSRSDGGESRVSLSGKVAKGWKETVTDVWGNTVSEKFYDENGLLREETNKQADKESRTTYWEYTGQKKASNVYSKTSGISTTTTAYYDEDGALQWSSVNEYGRATGTHVEVDNRTVTDASGAVIFTYEQSKDLRTNLVTGVYKDASGKEIGHYTKDTETGVYTKLAPVYGLRTGNILWYTETSMDQEGLTTTKKYDTSMKLLSSSSSQTKEDTTEDNHKTTSYYKDGSDKPWKIVTNYDDGRSINVNGTPYDVEGDYTETVKYNQAGEKVASETSKNLEQGMVANETQYFNQNGELVYSRLDMKDYNGTNEWQYRWGSLYLDADGNEIGWWRQEDNGDRAEKWPDTTFANNITGYYETVTSDDGKVTISREYDKDNNLIGETYRKESVIITDDTVTTTTSKQDGTIVTLKIESRDEDMVTTKERMVSYSPWNGKYESETVTYPATDEYRFTASKTYDDNGNLTTYGWTWEEDSYDYTEEYWVNDQLKEFSQDDNLGENGSYTEAYNPDGSFYQWSESDIDGSSSYWWYGDDGVIDSKSETTADGVTNVTYYDRNGNVKSSEKGITTTYFWGSDGPSDAADTEFYAQDSVVWNASTPVYTKHVEPDPDGGTVSTWKDTAGNEKVIKSSGTTVTLTNAADGWHNAFGSEWYLVEGGQMVTGWKNYGGSWYYFDESGKMATGLVTEGNSTYAMSSNGVWTASGWNVDASGDYEYVENGQAVTGWKNLGGKWYYFDDGWYIDTENYDSEMGWKQGAHGKMVTGAKKIWNASWTDQITYFFNSDGSLDTTPGWKTNGVDVFYFDEGGARATGWRQIGGDWFYFNDKGVMRNGWVSDGNGWRYMDDATGVMIENGWVQEKFEDTWYYMDGNGQMATGWRLVDGAWYYLKDDGAMATNEWAKSGNSWYYLDADGEMATGWVEDQGKWYHLNGGGTMDTGWVQDGASWYYMGADGTMQTGEVTIDGTVNVFDDNGVWIGTK